MLTSLLRPGFFVLCTLISVMLCTTATAQTQDATITDTPGANAEFYERYFHTYNSDYQYYFMRKRLRLNQVLASASINQQANGSTDTEFKAFLPIYYGEDFSFLLPFYFYRFPVSDAQGKDLPFNAVQNFFWQAIFNININDDMTLALITESHHIGTEASQVSLIGNDVAEFVLLNWELTPTLTFAPAARGKIFWDSNREANYAATPAGHFIWRPTESLSLISGLPSLLGVEWDAPHQVDFAAHITLGEGNINAMAALRKGIGQHAAITARVLRDGYDGAYIPEFKKEIKEQEVVVNQISQYKNRAQLELELYPSDNSMIQLKGGYGFDEGITLERNNTALQTLAGEDGFYAGFTFMTSYNMDPQ